MCKQSGSEHPCLDLLGNRICEFLTLPESMKFFSNVDLSKGMSSHLSHPHQHLVLSIQLLNFCSSDGCKMLSEDSCWVFYLKFFTWEYFQTYGKVEKQYKGLSDTLYPDSPIVNILPHFIYLSLCIYFSESLQIKLCAVCALMPKQFNVYILRIRTSLILIKYNDPLQEN